MVLNRIAPVPSSSHSRACDFEMLFCMGGFLSALRRMHATLSCRETCVRHLLGSRTIRFNIDEVDFIC
jgi:hypothetical protein